MAQLNDEIWLIGTGLMAEEYAKVLSFLGLSVKVIGRGIENCEKFQRKYPFEVISGGIENYLNSKPQIPSQAIIAVGIEALKDTTIELLKYGVTDILLEKPGVGNPNEIYDILNVLNDKANVLLAYNRRFYSSIRTVRDLINKDGGVLSFTFEFTEWAHVIKDLSKHPTEHSNWFLGNSTHVIDTAFYLGGQPIEISSFFAGTLDWHPTSSIFTGAGKTNEGALFSYIANWNSPGRWSIELMTKNYRYFLKPMEKLFVQKIGSLEISPIDLEDNQVDIDFKPGIYKQTVSFLEKDYSQFCNIVDQFKMMNTYVQMSGYEFNGSKC